ncbi:MAG TPA: hypothetical protein VMF60_04355 [Acidimicrobiales bacterium]|nr:hypothetical protein [Acidimicrobiales bacterium]
MRVLAVAVALAVPASVAAVGISSVAGATPTTVVCKKLSGNVNSTVTIKGSKCHAKPPHGYGNLTGSAAALASGGALTWSGTGGLAGITISAPDVSGTPPTCPNGWSGVNAVGTILTGTDTGTNTYDADLVNGPFVANVCINNRSGKVKFAAHTTNTF